MDSKSLMILRKIATSLEKKQLPINAFPSNDIIEMLNASYKEKRQREDQIWANSITSLEFLFSEALNNNNSELLTELLYKITDETAEWQESIRTQAIITNYQKKCREVYQAFYSNKNIDAPKNKFTGKGVIYTAITGNYDTLWEPEIINNHYDYVCFTNNPDLKSSVWDIRLMDNDENLDNIRLARKHKILCHKYLAEYDYSIYIDGKIKIIGNLAEYVRKYGKSSDMLCFPHFVRSCAYEEAIACVQYQKDNAEIILKQMQQYGNEGYPANNGMIDSACLVRSHKSEKLQEILSVWWEEVKTKSRRDQLSVGYAFWKNNATYDICDLFVYNNPYICKSRAGEAPY